ncbi:primary-amine oxidase [Allocatelliglobosispora scoriae]|uniref:Amine oxidase n=1 Tax=Allocatelliglobosispora scoriae TaxID=643052 RepID=A0A841BZI9_9ACTN|nr:primary-amine oxidase [Allocatelliglobosispora scoriae]MBB5873006.1 primary-amine oxidase [Allocatelliglobosispora scoriae]
MSHHPLDRLTADEIDAARVVLEQAGLLTPTTRFAVVQLVEPSRAELAAFREGDPVDRRVRSVLLDVATGATRTSIVSATHARVVSVTDVDTAQGQAPIMLEEFMLVDEIVKADETWAKAMAVRGITDLSLVRPCPLSAGDFDLPGEKGRRLLRVLSFLANREEDHCWAHPIDGIVAYVDLIEKRVIKVIDQAEFPIPAEEGNFDDPAYVGPMRTTLKPISITQPDGPSFSVDGSLVTWEGWQFRVGYDAREGLVLHQISLQGRPLIHRASIAEMVVPYADPSPVRFWQNYFDAGEYLLGVNVNALDLGCDCLGEIHYFDAVLADGEGRPAVFPNAICLHEEDHGVLWKHTDLFTGSKNTRRQRRLVISFFVTVGNYDYGFYWYLYLDGTIQFESKATGVMFTSSYQDDSPYATEVAPGLGAPYHQHLFSARLDMTVDGPRNAVDELQVQRVPVSAENPVGNAFTRSSTRLKRESEAQRLADPLNGRVWRIVNPESANRMGRPVGYQLHAQGTPVLLADPSSSIHRRAGFATKHLWVTRYAEDERYPAGELVNQSTPHAGLPTYAAADRDIDGQEIVVWHTFGSTHFPRLEDWPVMPVETTGFTLKPVGFFDRNPTLDVPDSRELTAHGEGAHSCACC